MTDEKRKKSLRNWIATAEYDLTTAEHMLTTGRYIYVVFMCHLAIEKTLKAHVEALEDKLPPKIHDLVTLSDRAALEIPEDMNRILLELNKVSVPTRYPEDLQNSLAQFTNEYCSRIINETRGLLQWLRSHPRFAAL